MALVYRLENEKKVGVFGLGGAYAYLDGRSLKRHPSSPYDMPSPYSEGEEGSDLAKKFNRYGVEGCAPSYLRFGFATKKQLKVAFPCALGRKHMKKRLNIKVSVYEVPKEHVVKGHHQVVFDIDEAKYVGELDPSTLKLVKSS